MRGLLKCRTSTACSRNAAANSGPPRAGCLAKTKFALEGFLYGVAALPERAQEIPETAGDALAHQAGVQHTVEGAMAASNLESQAVFGPKVCHARFPWLLTVRS